MGRKPTVKLTEIFTKYPDKAQQFFKINRECGHYPSLELVEHYMKRYGDRFFAHIYCLHFHSKEGVDKLPRAKKGGR